MAHEQKKKGQEPPCGFNPVCGDLRRIFAADFRDSAT